MKKYILLFILFASIISGTKAQFTIAYSPGYGSYKMDDLKSLLNNMTSNASGQLNGVPVKVVDNFPGYIAHSVDLSYRISRHEFGLRGTYLTTGGKVAYSDYSGEYYGKLTLNGYRFGLNYRFYIPAADFGNSGSLSFFLEASPGITFSNLKSKEYLRILDQEQNVDENLDMDATGVSLLPQIGLKWDITSNIGVHVSGGYDFQLGSKFKSEGEKTMLKSDWSGIRINGGVSYTF